MKGCSRTMSNVVVVSGYVPLKVKHVSQEKYRELGDAMFQAAAAGGAQTYLGGGEFGELWLAKNYPGAAELPPAHEVAADRYDSPAEFVASNIIQHQRTTWALEAAE